MRRGVALLAPLAALAMAGSLSPLHAAPGAPPADATSRPPRTRAAARRLPPAPEIDPLADVERRVRIPLPAAGGEAALRPLPGGRAIAVDVRDTPAHVGAVVPEIPAPFVARVQPFAGGATLILGHPTRALRAALEPMRDGEVVLVVGAVSEQTRLRELAAIVARPIPAPPDLGSYLEVWEDAEAATRVGDLPLAQRLWTKLAEVRELRSLAHLGVANLYLISGHVNEARARLREVTSDNPRTPGAALAQLTALHLEALLGETPPTIEQVNTAVGSLGSRHYMAYGQLRAALVLAALDVPTLALDRMPAIDELPEPWQAPAHQLRADLLALALAVPAVAGDHRTVAARAAAWSDELADHPLRDALDLLLAPSWLAVGRADLAAARMRSRLRRPLDARDEGDVIGGLAAAYAELGDLEREAEVLRYALTDHPDLPGLADAVRSHVLRERATFDLDSALARARELRGLVPAGAAHEHLRRALWAVEVDLQLTYGDSAAQVAAIEGMRAAVGFDEPDLRAAQLALALARDGRHAAAEPALRAVIDRTTDAQRRDRLAYALAEVELALGRRADAERILTVLADHETRWGRIARVHLQQRTLARIVARLEGRTGDEPTLDGDAATSEEQGT